VPYDAAPRHAGRSKYTWRAMLRLAGDAIFSFSAAPLRLAGLAGAVVSLAALAYLAFALFAYFFTARAQPGWTSILATVLVIGGVQLIVLWILGEYVGRLYEEVKQRPIYIVRSPEGDSRRRGDG
jgi:dolichol-phosphate mannosyltransferase